MAAAWVAVALEPVPAAVDVPETAAARKLVEPAVAIEDRTVVIAVVVAVVMMVGVALAAWAAILVAALMASG